MSYEYVCPTEKGYERFSISKKDHNKIFKNRQTKWHSNYEYYVKDNHIIMYSVPTILTCIGSTLLFPIGLLANGLFNYKEAYKEMVVEMWYCKKYGNFSGDDIYKREGADDTFDKMLECRKL